MSENSEHSPDDTETETKTMENLPNDSSSKSETKLMMNQTDTALLEDEEMPTYISVSSVSRREDDADVVNAKRRENVSIEEEHSTSPYPSDDQAASSVYVLSSGEESEQLPYNDEDDEDEYGDSDDMENLELDNELDPGHSNNMKHLMDEEDDDDDDEEDEEDDDESPRRMHNYDEDIDDYDYDRASADFVLNKGLKRRDKEKSFSLQDLSVYRNDVYTEYNKRRHSNVGKQSYFNIPQNTIKQMMFPTIRRKQPMAGRYHHVQSKVKLYIKDIKEQNRRSVERHTKNHEDTIHGKSHTTEIHCKSNDTEGTKPIATNRTIKDYAEKTIKELEIAEACDKDGITYDASAIILNGQNNKNSLESIQEENTTTQLEINASLESAQDKRDTVNSDDKIKQKQNGTIKVIFSERENRQFADTSLGVQPSLIQNGHREVPTVLFNLRTLSYEEYMHGTSGSNQKVDLDQNVLEQEHTQPELYNNAEPMDVSETTTLENNVQQSINYPLRIENIKSIGTMANEVKSTNEEIIFDKVKRQTEEFDKATSDALQVVALKDQLNQKTVEYNNLCDTYQKQLAENVKMKQELEKLKKSLAKYEKENKQPPEQKIASIQTDFITDSITNENRAVNQAESTHVKQSNNKVSVSSVASTLSSIEQWTDSTCNLSLSMKPPTVTKALDSDDSMVLTNGMPRKNTHTLSPAFITSSRILQTLSNITQGKAKLESPLIQNSKKRLNESAAMESQNDDGSYQSQPSSSKKRKIADILGSSSFLQPFNASKTTAESHLKSNDMPKVDSQFKHPCDLANEKSQEDSSNIDTSQLKNAASLESKAESTDDLEDNVKCFVYHENENSKDRSFLILAQEPAKNKVINEKGRIRECGPFLLGNVEVRMSEINGTINIWGKEINDESITENENEMETSTEVKNDKKCYCWPKTPYTRFNGSMVCSSGKKSKIPAKLDLSSAASNISCLHSTLFNTPKLSHSKDKADNLCSPSVCVSSCEDCDSSKHRKEWLKYKRIHPQEKVHFCCTRNTDTLGHKCNSPLYKEKQKFENNCTCSKEKLSPKEQQRSFTRNLESNKHLHENIVTEDSDELACRYHTACHHSLHEPEENCSENRKCCSTSREASTCEHITINTDRDCNRSCNHCSHNVDDEEPLIALKQSKETPETRRRRLSGKRVRGLLMDLLRGCGDCYNPNAPSSSKSCLHKKDVPHVTSCPPQIKISSCASPEPSCLNQGQSGGRCCQIYAQRIESQLEEFRVEMEKVRSRSDAILDMLNMLHSVDTN